MALHVVLIMLKKLNLPVEREKKTVRNMLNQLLKFKPFNCTCMESFSVLQSVKRPPFFFFKYLQLFKVLLPEAEGALVFGPNKSLL